ncbi:MAG: M28 family peptidase [Paludibacteraceae bacterium]|nr:M28 family peptidase [Paludibacteraceae bacterium]
MKQFSLLIVVVWALMSCTSKSSAPIERPRFDADSAYSFVETQLSFGPRIPNSESHTRCAVWYIQKLRSYGFDVELQRGTMTDYAGKDQQVINILASRPSASKAQPVLLAAHYDTRPWCDAEEEYQDRFYNVPGANDGASGVAVLLEIARQISLYAKDSVYGVPVEIALLDCEDGGTPSFYTGMQREDTWCLGAQLWALNYTQDGEGRKAKGEGYQYGVVLDMVGAPDAQFPREYYSSHYAPNYQEHIWRQAKKLGYGRLFTNDYSLPITDDHYYINLGGVPCVDIIHYDAHTQTGFACWWHTREDNLQNIDKSTLQAVGEVILSCLNY